MIILGTLVNVAGILGGSAAMLIWRRNFSASAQNTTRTFLAIVTVLAGLHLFWTHTGGGFLRFLQQSFIVMVALSLGSLAGFLLGLQTGSNRLGRYASDLMDHAAKTRQRRFQEGFITTSILFCVAPLCFLGAVQEGLIGDWRSLGIKTCIDTLGVMAFVGVFGSNVAWVALPVLAWQGSLTLGVRLLAPWLAQHDLVQPVIATSGMLLCAVSLQIFQAARVRVADYLPSLVVAPILAWLWKLAFG